MGWVWLAIIGASAGGALAALGVARVLTSLVGAALALGAAGYALQGRPMLGGQPVAANVTPIEVDPGLVGFRTAIMDGGVATDALADAALRRGDPGAAAEVALAAIRADPRDAAAWTTLGRMLAAHDGNQVSPAALFAFQRAIRLAPRAPGPAFFLGLAYVDAGDFAAAAAPWQLALANAPRDAPYRADIAMRLMLLEKLAKGS